MKTVLLSDEQGHTIGTSEIIEAHTNGGKLHKAFSVVVTNANGNRILIQKRAQAKMLWAGYWANTCCSHPKEERSIEEEAATRLQEECGFTCSLTVHSSFVYKEDDPSGNGTEYEYDTILTGIIDEQTLLDPNPEEIEEIQWKDIEELKTDMTKYPNRYAPWFHTIMNTLFP